MSSCLLPVTIAMSSALLPVTIAMIKKSQRMGEDGDWAFDGYPYSKVTFI
jgi:hypothetical protein